MLETNHQWLPVVLAVFLPVTFLITYGIAVGNGHVEPGFPYISDTGTMPPESCIFGQLLNIGALICGLIIYIRYLHVKELFCDVPGKACLMRMNTAALYVGLVVNLGVSLVGNFQETSVIAVHLIGAFLAFAVGFVYCILQTVMSFKTPDMPGNSICIQRTRIALCVLDFILLVVLGVASNQASKKGPGSGTSHFKWTSDDPGYAEHLVATISEWLIAVVTVTFFATFYLEFKHFRFHYPKVSYYDSNVKRDITEQNQHVSAIS